MRSRRFALPAASGTLLAVGAALALLGAAAPARADPEISGVSTSPDRRGRLTVEVDAAFAAPGKLVVSGNVNGRTLRAKKRLPRGTRTVRFRFDAKKAGVRNSAEPLLFDLAATATERGAAQSSVVPVVAAVPVPLIVLGGLGTENAGDAGTAFATALDAAAGGVYAFGTKSSSLRFHGYESLSKPLDRLGDEFDAEVRAALRGTPFAKVDVAGFSMGGLVARTWAAEHGDGKVRKLLLLATPNEGAPLAYMAYQFADPESPFAGLLDGLPVDLSGLSDVFVPADSTEVLRTFFPSYTWAFTTFLGNRVPVPSSFLPDSESPLTALNAVPPPAGAEVHAVYYSDLVPDLVPQELAPFALGTVDEVDFTAILLGGTPDLAQIASGEGDGVVPVRSARMEDVPAWRAVIVDHDLGAGFHSTFGIDPRAAAEIATILVGTN